MMDPEERLIKAVINLDVDSVLEIIHGGACLNLPVHTDHERPTSALLESILLEKPKESFSICQILLLHGADPNSETGGRMPLPEAVSLNRIGIVSLLLEAGADPTAKDAKGSSGIDKARQHQFQNILDLLQGKSHKLDVRFNRYVFEDTSEEKENLKNDQATKFLRDVENIFCQDIVGTPSGVLGNLSKVSEDLDEIELKLEEIGFKTPVNASLKTNDVLTGLDAEMDWKDRVEDFLQNGRDASKTYSLPQTPAGKKNLQGHISGRNMFQNKLSGQNQTLKRGEQPEGNLSGACKFSTMGSMTSEASYRTCRSSVAASLASSGCISIAEEYVIQDIDNKVQLIEKRMPSLLDLALKDEELLNRLEEQAELPSEKNNEFSVGTISDHSASTIKRELDRFGDPPCGPITQETKRVYLLRLKRLKLGLVVPNSHIDAKFPPSLADSLRDISSITKKWQSLWELEEEMSSRFNSIEKNIAENINYLTRESVCKSSFNYLLLDPRKSQNLPYKVFSWGDQELWRTFIDSIFYIGKGTRSRPFQHLYDALKKKVSKNNSAKVNQILDIWKDGRGVVSLQVFNNAIAVEGYTREALMIDALGTDNLCNIKPGDYYGPSIHWPREKRLLLGTFLLYRAFKIFLQEGERQIRPVDLQGKNR